MEECSSLSEPSAVLSSPLLLLAILLANYLSYFIQTIIGRQVVVGVPITVTLTRPRDTLERRSTGELPTSDWLVGVSVKQFLGF